MYSWVITHLVTAFQTDLKFTSNPSIFVTINEPKQHTLLQKAIRPLVCSNQLFIEKLPCAECYIPIMCLSLKLESKFWMNKGRPRSVKGQRHVRENQVFSSLKIQFIVEITTAAGTKPSSPKVEANFSQVVSLKNALI